MIAVNVGVQIDSIGGPLLFVATAMHAPADVVRPFQQRHIIVRVCEANPRVRRSFGRSA